MLFSTTSFLDAPIQWQIGFQDPASPVMCGIIHFHNHLMYFLLVLGTFVVWLLLRAFIWLTVSNNIKNKTPSKFTHSTSLEVVWTLAPAALLLLIAGPSFAFLYPIDEVVAPNISLKASSHQWYWSCEYKNTFNQESGFIIENLNYGYMPIVVESFEGDTYNQWVLTTTEVEPLKNPSILNMENPGGDQPGGGDEPPQKRQRVWVDSGPGDDPSEDDESPPSPPATPPQEPANQPEAGPAADSHPSPTPEAPIQNPRQILRATQGNTLENNLFAQGFGNIGLGDQGAGADGEN